MSDSRPPALLSYGFRPFFLSAGLLAALFPATWVIALLSGHVPQTVYSPQIWHGHEMLFGYGVAVLAGFFLTAVPNWTGSPNLKGPALGLLMMLWIAGRLAPFLPLPHAVIALADLLFLPTLALVIAIPIVRKPMWRNIAFPIILLAMAAANLLVHLTYLQPEWGKPSQGLELATNLILLVIVWIFGRIYPFFASRVLPDVTFRTHKVLEIGSLISIGLLACAEFLPTNPTVMAITALALITHGLRLIGFHHKDIWRVPLIWILFLGYAWLVLGLGLKILATLDVIAPMYVRHALAGGAVGVMTLGMMVRVALGHTGRPLKPNLITISSFVFINLAMLIRVFGPMLLPQGYRYWLILSGSLWTLTFVCFLFTFAPILIHPRPDGKT